MHLFERKWKLTFMLLILPLVAVRAGAAQEAAVPAVAVESCSECHDDQTMAHGRGVHGEVNCASCHRSAAEHLADSDTPPGKAETASCMSCHRSSPKHLNWGSSDHARAAVQCRDCHGVHAPKSFAAAKGGVLVKDPTATLCVSCHQDVLPRLNMISHHPVKEGALSCTNCHDPHGSQATSLASQTEACTSCHQAVRGPHTFEHPPAAESCSACHDAHGSPNRKLLQVAQPMLCLQCHSIADNRHGQTGAAGSRITGAALRSCTSCHSQIHGSSFDQHLRF